jgi:hypothetical protein
MEAGYEHLAGRQKVVEEEWAAFQALERNKDEASARIAAARDKEMLLTIEKTVRTAVGEASAAQSALLDERFGRLAAEVKLLVEPMRSCIDEEERRLMDLVKKEDRDRHDLVIQIDGAVGSIRKDVFDEGGIEPRVRAIETGPRTRAFAWKLAIGSAAAGVVFGLLFEFGKKLFQ